MESDCRTIRNILDDYLVASGQVINFEKSVMCISKSISWDKGTRLSSIIGVRQVKCHERYLRLPSMNYRNKNKLFNVIRNRVWTKIRGWRGKCLSVGGK